jgi:hypothetical protein
MSYNSYLTLKRMNNILSLYGVMVSKQFIYRYNMVDGEYTSVIYAHKIDKNPNSRTRQRLYVLGNNNQERLEYVLSNLDAIF